MLSQRNAKWLLVVGAECFKGSHRQAPAQPDGSSVAFWTSVQLCVPSFWVISSLLRIPVDLAETRPCTTDSSWFLLHRLTRTHMHAYTQMLCMSFWDSVNLSRVTNHHSTRVPSPPPHCPPHPTLAHNRITFQAAHFRCQIKWIRLHLGLFGATFLE